jgi:hypothetical protein
VLFAFFHIVSQLVPPAGKVYFFGRNNIGKKNAMPRGLFLSPKFVNIKLFYWMVQPDAQGNT